MSDNHMQYKIIFAISISRSWKVQAYGRRQKADKVFNEAKSHNNM